MCSTIGVDAMYSSIAVRTPAAKHSATCRTLIRAPDPVISGHLTQPSTQHIDVQTDPFGHAGGLGIAASVRILDLVGPAGLWRDSAHIIGKSPPSGQCTGRLLAQCTGRLPQQQDTPQVLRVALGHPAQVLPPESQDQPGAPQVATGQLMGEMPLTIGPVHPGLETHMNIH